MVQLDVAVTDKKGDYVTRLTPGDFAVFEDGIRQKIATFGEESEAPRSLQDFEPGEAKPNLVESFAPNLRPGSSPGLSRDGSSDGASPFAGASVFILFDTSNYMYRGFVFAQDAIADFVRSLDHPDRLAFYSYSRNFSRAALLTPDRSLVLHGVRATVAGDDAALYDALLMTLKDAAKLSGRRVVVVFSNGPDNASVVSPEDVRELAQSEGIPIYMISTQEARLDPLSTAVFERVSVPGSLEIPPAIAIALDAATRRGEPYDGVVALGCVIRGETSHYDIVAGESARGLMDLALSHRLAVGNGILTVDTEEQAVARARPDKWDKGGGAARAALALVRLKRRLAAARS